MQERKLYETVVIGWVGTRCVSDAVHCTRCGELSFALDAHDAARIAARHAC